MLHLTAEPHEARPMWTVEGTIDMQKLPVLEAEKGRSKPGVLSSSGRVVKVVVVLVVVVVVTVVVVATQVTVLDVPKPVQFVPLNTCPGGQLVVHAVQVLVSRSRPAPGHGVRYWPGLHDWRHGMQA